MATFQTRCFGDDYQTNFDVEAYLARKYPAVEGDKSLSPTKGWLIQNTKWVEAFASEKVAGQRLLEFGCGPCIQTVIPSSRRFEEIYMCEYGAPNRQAIQDWIDRKPTAHDWTPFFEFVAEKEGEGATHQEIEARLRSKIQGIIPCDITKDNLFEPNHFEPEFFDCITTSFCLEVAIKTEGEFKAGLKKLSSFLKPGGYFVMAGPLFEHYYPVGDKLFHSFTMSPQGLEKSFEEAGFVKISVYEHEVRPSHGDNSDAKGWYFLTCFKTK